MTVWFEPSVVIVENTSVIQNLECVDWLNKRILFLFYKFVRCLTDTGEDSKLVHRRKRPKVETLFSSFFDAFERRVWLSAESKILALIFGDFRLYRLTLRVHHILRITNFFRTMYEYEKYATKFESNLRLSVHF